MKAENWRKVKDLLQQVLAVEPAERVEILRKLPVDNEVRREVESLLTFENESEDLMDLPAIEFSKDFFASEIEQKNLLLGEIVGIYKIIRELGFGGMGAVYLAERIDGKFEQKVALKLLKREMNTNYLRRRFQQERKILASLEHPNIARLIDAGTTADKIPFLAMEYVEGVPITEYCQQNDLDLNERLELFTKICQAVDFAHRNLIVHRDLKPSNILVTENGAPKLLDFGISKIISNEFESADSATVTKLGAMTPEYASPEQIKGESVTTATDIYSLGVILCELLSGQRPFMQNGKNIQEVLRSVVEKEPPLPSNVVGKFDVGKNENSENSKGLVNGTVVENFSGKSNSENITAEIQTPKTSQVWRVNINPQKLRGDLDNIVLKALRKEPERRYSSAEKFADDIKRHLEGLPVSARPDTFTYRAEKFIRRNRLSVLAGILIFAAIAGGIVTTLWQAGIARAERVKAENRFRDVRKLANSYLFDVYPQIENLEGSLKAREAILKNALEYLDNLSIEASGDAELQSELATAYEKVGDVQGAINNQSLGNTKAGLESYGKARNLREAVLAADTANLEAKEKLANNYYVTARTLWNNSQTKEAEESFENALRLRRELVAAQPDSVTAQNRLAVLLIDYSAIPVFNFQTEKTLVLLNEALAIIENLRQKEPENADIKKSLTRGLRLLGKAKASASDYAGALEGLNTAVVVSQELAKQFPDDFRVQRSVWLTDSIICEVLIDEGIGKKAVEGCVKTIDFNREVIRKEPSNGVAAYDLAISYFNLARAFRLDDKLQNTIENADQAVQVMTKLVEKNPDNTEYKRNIAVYETEKARALIKLKQFDKAIPLLQKVQADLKPVIEADTEVTTYQYDLALADRLLAQAYFAKGEREKAVANISNAIEIIRKLGELNSLKESEKNLMVEMENEKASYLQ